MLTISYKDGKKRMTRRIPIKGKVISWNRGTFASRSGNVTHGIKIIYGIKIKGGAGKGGRIKKSKVTKIIGIPSTASDVRVKK